MKKIVGIVLLVFGLFSFVFCVSVGLLQVAGKKMTDDQLNAAGVIGMSSAIVIGCSCAMLGFMDEKKKQD